MWRVTAGDLRNEHTLVSAASAARATQKGRRRDTYAMRREELAGFSDTVSKKSKKPRVGLGNLRCSLYKGAGHNGHGEGICGRKM